MTKVDDIAGLKIRVVQQPVMIDLFNALGANAVPMPFPEVYPALETGAIDGQENPFPNILATKLFEVQKYLTVTNHVYNPQVVLVSGKLWTALNDGGARSCCRTAATEARDFQRADLAGDQRRGPGAAQGGGRGDHRAARPRRRRSCARRPSRWSRSRSRRPTPSW